MRIVVVEDEAPSRAGLVRLLESVDPSIKVVAQAENGVEGMEMIRQYLPDMAIVDIRMPEMDGLEMIERLSDLSLPCRYIIVSAYSDFEYARRAMRYGSCDYILKPVTFEEMEKLLFSFMDRLPPNPLGEGSLEETHPLPEDAHPLVQGAVQAIRENFSSPLTLEETATRFHVTSEYLSLLFSRQMGIGFSGYLKRMRVEQAKRLLLEQRFSVQDIALQVGFRSHNYFCKIFKETTGLSTTAFVRQYLHHQ